MHQDASHDELTGVATLRSAIIAASISETGEHVRFSSPYSFSSTCSADYTDSPKDAQDCDDIGSAGQKNDMMMDYHEASPPPPPAHSVSLAPASRAGCYAPEQGIAFTMSPSVSPARQVPVLRGASAFYVGSHSCPDDQFHGLALFASACQTAATTSPLRPSLNLSPRYTYHLTGMPPPRAQRLSLVQTLSPIYSLHRDLGLEDLGLDRIGQRQLASIGFPGSHGI